MADIETIIRYDGPALAGHEMDVEQLAPALLALASLIQTANADLNGGEATIRVTVDANVEQKCFQIKIKLLQTLLQKAKTFLDEDDVSTVKDIAEWIGISAGGGWSVFKVLAALVGRGSKPGTSLTTGDGATIYQIAGDAHFHGVSPEVLKLLENPVVVEKAKAVLKPLERPGYETLGFYERDGEAAFTVNKEQAAGILALPSPERAEVEIAEDDAVVTPIPGRAGIKSRRDEGKAQWELKWAGKSVWANIGDDEWLASYQAGEIDLPVGTWLDIIMEMTTSRSNPDAPPTFRVVKVNGTIRPAPSRQGRMFDDDPS